MQGEKECPFYLRTGCCKYSANCRFHHPEPVSIPANYLTARFEKDGYRQGLASGKSKSPKASFPLQRASVELSSSLDASSPSYIPRILLPHQVFHTSKLSTEYGEYQVIFFLKYFSCATITIFAPVQSYLLLGMVLIFNCDQTFLLSCLVTAWTKVWVWHEFHLILLIQVLNYIDFFCSG